MSHVGIFWFVPANLGGWSALVADMAPIERVPERAGIKRYPDTHAHQWGRLARVGAKRLRASGYPWRIADADFRAYPRGRVDFEVGGRRFIVRVDTVIQRPAFINSVVAEFELPVGHTTVLDEADYASTRHVGPPKPWD